MGARTPRPGSDSVTPLARVLWEADTLHATSVVAATQASSVAAYAKAKHNLNKSQTDAVAQAAERGLTIIWGPPGTGKTQTLAGCIHGLVHDAVRRGQPLKLLVAGPTYKAVEEIIGRVVEALILDPAKKVLALLHDDDLSSQSNSFEAKIVAALTRCLRQTVSAELDGRGAVTHATPTPDQFWGQCIGIVTPHRAQRALVVRELRSIFPSDPPNLIDSAVDTVEKFQGGQRHTIVVTFGVGDADVIMGEEAFLMQLERTNVAISRAMAKCLVVMPMTLAGHVPQDKKAIETAHAIKDYVDEFCNQELVDQVSFGSTSRQAKLRYHQ